MRQSGFFIAIPILIGADERETRLLGPESIGPISNFFVIGNISAGNSEYGCQRCFY